MLNWLMKKAASLLWLKASIKKRQALHLWFHARGLDIDEDHKAQSIWQPWKELMEYWKKGSN